MADFPRYTWNPRAMRFRSNRTGRFVTPGQVRRALDVALDNEARRGRSLAEQLRTGALPVETFQLEMQGVIRNTQLFAAAAGRGGWQSFDASAWGFIGQRVREQQAFLTKLVIEVRTGLPLDGKFLERAGSYAKAAKPAYFANRAEAVQDNGFDQIRSITHDAEHCQQCLDQEAKGWQSFAEFVPLGDRTCIFNDACSAEIRNSVTGQVMAA